MAEDALKPVITVMPDQPSWLRDHRKMLWTAFGVAAAAGGYLVYRAFAGNPDKTVYVEPETLRHIQDGISKGHYSDPRLDGEL